MEQSFGDIDGQEAYHSLDLGTERVNRRLVQVRLHKRAHSRHAVGCHFVALDETFPVKLLYRIRVHRPSPYPDHRKRWPYKM